MHPKIKPTEFILLFPELTQDMQEPLLDALTRDARNEHGQLAPPGYVKANQETQAAHCNKNVKDVLRGLFDLTNEFNETYAALYDRHDEAEVVAATLAHLLAGVVGSQRQFERCANLVLCGLSAPQRCFPNFVQERAKLAVVPQLQFEDERRDVLARKPRAQPSLREYHDEDGADRPGFHHLRQNALMKLNARWVAEKTVADVAPYQGGLNGMAVALTGRLLNGMGPPSHRLTDQRPKNNREPG